MNENVDSQHIFRNVRVSASGGEASEGIFNLYSSPLLENVTVSASGADQVYGIHNLISSANMMNVMVSSSDGGYVYGILNNTSGELIMNNVTVTASNGITQTYGLYNSITSTTIPNSDISVFGGTENIGVANWDGAAPMDILRIHNTQISSSDNTLLLGAPFCIRIDLCIFLKCWRSQPKSWWWVQTPRNHRATGCRFVSRWRL